jgi:hypothetical protein
MITMKRVNETAKMQLLRSELASSDVGAELEAEDAARTAAPPKMQLVQQLLRSSACSSSYSSSSEDAARTAAPPKMQLVQQPGMGAKGQGREREGRGRGRGGWGRGHEGDGARRRPAGWRRARRRSGCGGV